MQIGRVLIKKLTVPVYGTSLWIVVSPSITLSIDTVEDLIDKRIADNKKSLAAYSYAYEDHDGKYRILIFVKPNASPGTIAHECNHAVSTILHWHGVKPSFSNDEHESYYLEQIVDKVHRTIKQYENIPS